MIKETELRIDSCVLDPQGCIRRVDYVTRGVVGLKNQVGGTDKYQTYPIFSGNILELEPVPISIEILEKCGFERLDRFYERDEILLLKCDDIVYYYYSNHSDKRAELKHLHQLQNLYFALTGEELQINMQ